MLEPKQVYFLQLLGTLISFPCRIYIVPQQGPSEWYYAPVPIIGPLTGGALGAVAFFACIQLNDYPEWSTVDTSTFGGSWEI